ncbi:MAG: hypothetical protein Q7R92_04935 [bacterium]|nr:hypothetical protein [bacterium]
MDYKSILGVIAVALAIAGDIPYFINIFRKKTKPHIFSWLVWGIEVGVAFFAQLAKGGGAGTWVTGFTALSCLAVAGLALFYGEKKITKIDWASFIGALLGIVFWQLTGDPLLAVILAASVDTLGFVPTFRKAYNKPLEETTTTFSFGAIKFAISLAALESFSLTTALFPATLVLSNSAFVIMVLLRRQALAKANAMTVRP